MLVNMYGYELDSYEIAALHDYGHIHGGEEDLLMPYRSDGLTYVGGEAAAWTHDPQ